MAGFRDDSTWKGRYAQLAGEYDAQRESWAVREKALCRAVVRLAMATHGLDAAIDPLLGQVRDLVRKGVRSEKVLEQLDAITDTLIRMDRPQAPGDPRLLFQFLTHCTPSEEARRGLERVQERFHGGQFADSKSLFVAILQVVNQPTLPVAETGQTGSPGLLAKLLAGNRKSNGSTGLSALREKMLAVLDSLEVPAAEELQVHHFRERMRGGQDAGSLEAVLEDLVVLLGKVKAGVQKEQQQIEEFLAGLTGKLGELEAEAGAMAALTSAVVREGRAMNSTFSGHMEALRSSAQGATDLVQLKDLLYGRLDAIVGQINGYREHEARRVAEMERQMQVLQGRLQEMEVEAGDLRARLRAAHSAALRDSLTGLPNRGAYEERMQQEFLRWRRFGEPLSILMWDVDHFKHINDRFGHPAGDKALCVIGRQLSSGIRETDFVARYGGEEFVMLLPGADAKAAKGVAEGLQARIRQCGFNSEGKPLVITVSCGISELRAGDTPQAALERADRALYQAKRLGRDRCVMAA